MPALNPETCGQALLLTNQRQLMAPGFFREFFGHDSAKYSLSAQTLWGKTEDHSSLYLLAIRIVILKDLGPFVSFLFHFFYTLLRLW